MIHTPHAKVGTFSLVMRINIVDCSATGLYFHGIHDDVSSDVGIANLLKRLHGQRRLLLVNPLAFLGIAMAEYGRTCERDRACSDLDVLTVERQTGMTSVRVQSLSLQASEDYEQLTKALHNCNTNLIFLDHMNHFEMALGRFFKETLIKFQSIRERRLLETIPADIDDILIQNIDYLLSTAEMRRHQAQCLHRRTQSQINVVHSIISQRDSKVNISVAEDSKKIAAAAKRDSLAMKTVSMLTLIFLPGTFVAVRFRPSIFSPCTCSFKTDEN